MRRHTQDAGTTRGRVQLTKMRSDPIKNSSKLNDGASSKAWLSKIGVWLLLPAGVLAVLILFLPVLAEFLIGTGDTPQGIKPVFKLLMASQNRLMRILGVIWIFFLGSCFASFLNVVAWRVPRGGSINGSSHCPDCDQKLRFQDNTPIIGWIRNGGRCSNCGQSIPVRYLLVEILLGSLFLLIASFELLSGGWNLPLRPIDRFSGLEYLFLYPKMDLIALTVYHLTLTCLLFTFTLIKNETLKIPRGVWFVGLVFGFAMPLIWPTMTLVGWELGQIETSVFEPQPLKQRGAFNQLMTLGMGLTIGTVLGLILTRLRNGSEPEHPYVFQPTFIKEEIAALSLIGLFLGWQSAVSIFLFSVALILLVRVLRIRWRAMGPSGCLLVATVLHLLCWRILTNCPYWPSGKSGSFAALIGSI